MSTASGSDGWKPPNVWRTVAASTNLTTVSGIPKRRAAVIIFENNNVAVQTAVFTGDDGVNVTVSVPLQSVYPPLYGDFETVGALGATVTCVAGWIDDGSVQLNA